MRLEQYLKEATFEGDKKVRDKANKFYDTTMKYIKKSDPAKLMQYIPEKGIVLYAKEFSIYNDLVIIVNPGNNRMGGFTDEAKIGSSTYKVIMVYGLKRAYHELTPEFMNKTYIDRGTFIHEFIHYLDSQRGTYKGSREALAKGDKEYYNTASEFNAYFIEISAFVENFIHTAVKSKSKNIYDEWLVTFDTFNKAINTTLSKDRTLSDYLSLLNKKYKPKYLKRLFTLYQGLKTYWNK